jgi:hypothetical protein
VAGPLQCEHSSWSVCEPWLVDRATRRRKGRCHPPRTKLEPQRRGSCREAVNTPRSGNVAVQRAWGSNRATGCSDPRPRTTGTAGGRWQAAGNWWQARGSKWQAAGSRWQAWVQLLKIYSLLGSKLGLLMVNFGLV